MTRKINRKLLLIGILVVVAISLIYSRGGVQEAAEPESLEIIHVTFGVSPRTVVTYPYGGVLVGISHRCTVDDELILKKIEIFGGDRRILIKSIVPDKSLKAIGNKLARLDNISKEIKSLTEKSQSITPEQQEKGVSLQAEGISLSEEVRSESFFFEIPGNGVDLRDLKENPLVPGDKISLTLDVYATHNGEPLKKTITKSIEITPKY